MTSTPIQLVFLGTGSAQPSSTRNHSSLALNLNSETWLFDCGEGTQHQILKAPSVKITRIRRFFITHLHGDHCFGLPGLLCTLAGTYSNQDTNYHVEIIGPKNTRLYIRNALIMTGSSLGMVRYTVHELVMSSDHAVPINNEDPMNNYINDVTESQNTVPVIQSTLHQNEDMGKDITPGIDEIWRNIVIESGWTVHAGPLEHRIQCLGFVLEEDSMTGSLILEKVMPLITKHKDALTVQLNGKNPMSLISNLKLPGGRIDFPDGTVLHSHECVSPDRPGRKIVILGDTCNSNLLKDISMDADLLVHEATNACLKSDLALGLAYESVQKSTVEHGHSTPQMAGVFSNVINAKNTILTHFSSRYKGDREEESVTIMDEICDLAMDVAGARNIVCAYDLFSFELGRKL